jgi:hypothetical protein
MVNHSATPARQTAGKLRRINFDGREICLKVEMRRFTPELSLSKFAYIGRCGGKNIFLALKSGLNGWGRETRYVKRLM